MSCIFDDLHTGVFTPPASSLLCAYVPIQPHRWIRVRDLDDLSASLERLRRSIPEVFGNDAPQAEQQRRLVDLVSFAYPHPLLLEGLTFVTPLRRWMLEEL
jgi:hypothetical protein